MSNKTFLGEELFPKEKEENLKNFQYKGSDASLLYKYVFGKLAELLVEKVIPPSIA